MRCSLAAPVWGGAGVAEDAGLTREVDRLLARLAEGADLRETLEEVLDVISRASGCESAGIRWRAGEDYPYYVTRGFGRDFVVIEGPLCVRDAASLILRHPNGTPQLACMCGAVLQGKTEPARPYFTSGGSFWTNGTTRLLGSGQLRGTAIQPRAYCNAVGYESVALIPLWCGGITHGLLQLNSRAPGRFTEELLERHEELARRIAQAAADRLEQASSQHS